MLSSWILFLCLTIYGKEKFQTIVIHTKNKLLKKKNKFKIIAPIVTLITLPKIITTFLNLLIFPLIILLIFPLKILLISWSLSALILTSVSFMGCNNLISSGDCSLWIYSKLISSSIYLYNLYLYIVTETLTIAPF